MLLFDNKIYNYKIGFNIREFAAKVAKLKIFVFQYINIDLQ